MIARFWRRIGTRVGPLARDRILAGFLALAAVGSVVDGHAADPRAPVLVGVALALASTLPVAVRRARPVEGLLVSAGAFALGIALQTGDEVAWLATVVMIFSVASRRPRRESLRLAGLAALLVGLGTLVDDPRRAGELVFVGAVFAAAWAIGGQVRLRRQRAVDRAEAADAEARARELRAEQRIADERIRIARELHDVVAHSVSVMVIQAGAARTVLVRDPERATEAMRTVEETGRGALNEMRRLLGVLRGSEAGARLPQPSALDIEHLVAQSRDAGLDVSLSVAGDLGSVTDTVGVSAYRIVQEALTNVRRHAGASATAAVRLDYARGRLEVWVTDAGGDGATGLTSEGEGHGMVGMRERVDTHGGSLTAGPRPAGGWEVHAMLPVDDEEDPA